MIPVVEKAIRDSDLGLNPATSGDLIRVPMPALTEERRKELIKVVHKEAEAARDRRAQRPPRRERAAEEALKDKQCSEDDERHAHDDLQKLTDRFIAEIDKLLQAKEADLHGDLGGSRATIDDVHRAPRATFPSARAIAAPRRDHHGRQRPLGEQAPAAARRRPPQGRRGGARDGPRGDRAAASST